MNTISEGYTPLEKFDLELQQAPTSGRNQTEIDFKEACLLIEQHLARKVPQKVVLEKFNAAYGYKLHPPRFRKMLLDERKRRAEAGDVVLCTACNQPLPHEANVSAEINNTEEQ